MAVLMTKPQNELTSLPDEIIRLYEFLPIGVIIWRLEDFDDIGSFRLLFANRIGEKFTDSNMKQFIGMAMRDCYPYLLEETNLPNLYREVLLTQKSLLLSELYYNDHNIKDTYFSLSAFPYNQEIVVAYFTNISNEKKALQDVKIKQMQLELEHMARINLLGELSSSISHELNQPLSAITSFAHGCVNLLQGNSKISLNVLLQSLQMIEGQACRAGNIVRRLRSLSKKEALSKEALKLDDVIRDTLSFIDFDLSGNDIVVQLQNEHDALLVEGDRVLLQQLLLNLITNAIDAMNTKPVRRLTLKIDVNLDLNLIILKIRDTGCGIPDTQLHEVLSPFFTTKKNGLGMGLPICITILEKHQGILSLKSNKSGTTAIIQLPYNKEIQ